MAPTAMAGVVARVRCRVRIPALPGSANGTFAQFGRRALSQRARGTVNRDFKIVSLKNNSAARGHKIETQVDAKEIVNKQIPSEYLVHPASNTDWQVIRREHFKAIPIPKSWERELETLQERIGVKFNDATHLMCALTHHGAFSHNQVAGGVPAHRLSNRSLEFLGDSVLGMAVASYLFQAQPLHQEGQLTQSKWALVNNQTLSKICVNDLKIDKLILVAADYSLARQSSKSIYVKGRTTIQSGAVESLIAAVYLDKGLEAALAFVNTKILPHAIKYATHESVWEPIGALQTLLQANGFGHPVYKHLPAPQQSVVFQVSLIVKGQSILTESGPSYKAARAKAAEAGYRHYKAIFGDETK